MFFSLKQGLPIGLKDLFSGPNDSGHSDLSFNFKGAVSRDFLQFFYFMNRSHLGL